VTQAFLPPSPTPDPAGGRTTTRRTPAVLSLHAPHPETGLPTTWQVTAAAADGVPGGYLVEWADGEIHSPAVWMQARRSSELATEDEVLALVRRLLFGQD
jgi:hypothetical protein